MLEKLKKAKIDLALTHPFFGVLLVKLPLKKDSSQPTFYTDGKIIGYNPDFAQSKSVAELKTILCHEVLHVACLHPWRRGAREPRKFNIACDYAINSILEKNKFLMPDEALLDPQFSGKCAEEIYNKIPDPPNNNQGQGKDNTGGFGEVRDYPGESQAEMEQAAMDMEISAQYAEKMAKGYGIDPGLSQALAEIKGKKLDWPNMLRKFMTDIYKSDYSFSRPCRRYLPHGLFLPDLYSRELGMVVLAVDTSASVSQDELNGFFSEINAIMQECNPRETMLIQCDAGIQSVETYGKGDIPTPEVKGRGGTSFVPVFKKMVDDGLEPACLIYLTDLGVNWGEITENIKPTYPTIWVSTNHHSMAPFGETLYI